MKVLQLKLNSNHTFKTKQLNIKITSSTCTKIFAKITIPNRSNNNHNNNNNLNSLLKKYLKLTKISTVLFLITFNRTNKVTI